MSNTRYVQYGCGWSAPNSWKNYGASPTLRFERLPLIGKLYTKNQSRFPENVEYGDIVKGLPIPDEECDLIYCSHVIEHLSLVDLRKALKNTYCKLRVGGIFRFVLPDLEYHIKKYIDDPSADAALLFMKETYLGKERSRGLKNFVLWIGNSHHLWMWDYKSIERELRDVGFIKIRRAQFGDSLNHKFKDVEDKSRWDNCLGVECSK
jgi:predicted SAM-dependent methyltransferase